MGKTCKPIKGRWREHVSAANRNKGYNLARAIRKYGEDSFLLGEIASVDTHERAFIYEKLYIRWFESHKPAKGYNLTFGGEGCPATEETRAKERMVRKGYVSEKGLAALLKWRREHPEHKPMKGRHHSEETKQKLSITKTGVPNLYWKGRKRTAEDRRKQAEATTRHDIPNEEIARLYEQGKSLNAIAAQYNASSAIIGIRLKKVGVKMRPRGGNQKKNQGENLCLPS